MFEIELKTMLEIDRLCDTNVSINLTQDNFKIEGLKICNFKFSATFQLIIIRWVLAFNVVSICIQIGSSSCPYLCVNMSCEMQTRLCIATLLAN